MIAALRQRGSMKAARGISLVEILVTILVVSIGLLGLAGLQGVSTQYNHSSYLRTHANNMAYDIADRMRANREAAMDGDYDADIPQGGAAPSGGSIADEDLQEWWAAIDDTLAEAEAEVDVDADGNARITIEWLDDRDQRADEERTEFELETRI